MWVALLPAAAIGYLLGSIPVGYLVGKAWGVDVREHGSGRTGGTNVWRATKQILPSLLTGLGDILKGVAAVYFGRFVLGSELAAALAGAAAVYGHNWSVFLGWRGGAGGVTTSAALIALSPLAGGIVVPIGIIVLIFSRLASLGTLTIATGALVALVALAWQVPSVLSWQDVIFGVLVAFAVVWALRPNLKRLASGSERRITLW